MGASRSGGNIAFSSIVEDESELESVMAADETRNEMWDKLVSWEEKRRGHWEY